MCGGMGAGGGRSRKKKGGGPAGGSRRNGGREGAGRRWRAHLLGPCSSPPPMHADIRVQPSCGSHAAAVGSHCLLPHGPLAPSATASARNTRSTHQCTRLLCHAFHTVCCSRHPFPHLYCTAFLLYTWPTSLYYPPRRKTRCTSVLRAQYLPASHTHTRTHTLAQIDITAAVQAQRQLQQANALLAEEKVHTSTLVGAHTFGHPHSLRPKPAASLPTVHTGTQYASCVLRSPLSPFKGPCPLHFLPHLLVRCHSSAPWLHLCPQLTLYPPPLPPSGCTSALNSPCTPLPSPPLAATLPSTHPVPPHLPPLAAHLTLESPCTPPAHLVTRRAPMPCCAGSLSSSTVSAGCRTWAGRASSFGRGQGVAPLRPDLGR